MAKSQSVVWRCQECNAVIECVHVSSALKTHFLETKHNRFRQMEETATALELYEIDGKVCGRIWLSGNQEG